MAYYSIHLPFLILALSIVQFATSTNPLYTICSNSQNFTSNSPYQKNLMEVLGQLYFKTPPTGFGQGSSGQYPNKVYGLSLCRGDVSIKDCLACVVEASTEIMKSCPKDKGAIIWYDKCYLKYSNDDFLGKIDKQNVFYMWNTQNVSTNPEEFNMKVKELLSKLSEDGCGVSKMYANGEVDIEEDKKIYGMVQSSRDLSNDDCKKCLDDAIGQLPQGEGKIGGRVVGGSCNIRGGGSKVELLHIMI